MRRLSQRLLQFASPVLAARNVLGDEHTDISVGAVLIRALQGADLPGVLVPMADEDVTYGSPSTNATAFTHPPPEE